MPIYMNYDGVTGDVTAKGHENWIELSSFQWGIGRGITSPVGGSKDREASAPSVSEIVVTKISDNSTTDMLKQSLTGDGKTVKIDFCKTDKDQFTPYYQIELDNTLISGLSFSSGGDRPMESISLNFTKVTFTDIQLSETNDDGSPVRVGYDLALGTPT
jgi:type VI secretion system secreted protein Hcp